MNRLYHRLCSSATPLDWLLSRNLKPRKLILRAFSDFPRKLDPTKLCAIRYLIHGTQIYCPLQDCLNQQSMNKTQEVAGLGMLRSRVRPYSLVCHTSRKQETRIIMGSLPFNVIAHAQDRKFKLYRIFILV